MSLVDSMKTAGAAPGAALDDLRTRITARPRETEAALREIREHLPQVYFSHAKSFMAQLDRNGSHDELRQAEMAVMTALTINPNTARSEDASWLITQLQLELEMRGLRMNPALKQTFLRNGGRFRDD